MEIGKRVEKFIQEHTRNCSNLMQVPTLDDKGNIVPEAHPWLTPDQARKAVEIAREETLQEVCDYLESIGHRYVIDGLKNILKK